MVEDMPCSDYWQVEKDEMNRQLQELLSESNALTEKEDTSRKREESRVQKDN